MDAEPVGAQWRRRAKTIPAMLLLTTSALAVAPVFAPAGLVWDLIHARRRLPTLRIYGFVVQYLLNDSIEILAAGPLWLAERMDRSPNHSESQRRYQVLQAWSIRVLARRAEELLGVVVSPPLTVTDILEPAPAIVICRHVNVLDASLPSLLYGRLGIHTRGVIMKELLADPGFDLLYQRAGSVFIPRDGSDVARELSAKVGKGLDDRTAVVIFPEGRLFRADALARALVRLANLDPARAARLSGLRHLLPPRPAGLSALLDAAPGVDVVAITHVGLDRYQSLADLARHVPIPDPILVTAERIDRTLIPDDPLDRVKWLDELWLRMDDWVHAQIE